MNIKEINLETESIEIIALIKDINFLPTKKGTEYATLELEDRSGSINAKKWTVYTQDKEEMKKGRVLKVQGTNNPYRGKSNIIIENYTVLDLNPDDFRTTALEKLDDVKKELVSLIESIQDEKLKNACLYEMAKDEFQEKFFIWPAAKSCHHDEKGGLLYHTTRMMRACNDLAETYKGIVNRDLLITGAFFHDLGKMNEMQPDVLGAGEYVKDSLLGHIYLGAQKVHDLEALGMVDKETSFLLQHMILSHHGKLEWGSPVVPATPEAIILHMVDNMDAKLFACQTELLPLESGELSTKSNFCLEGAKVYKQ